MFSHKHCMTNKQLEVCSKLEAELEKDFLYCQEKHEEARTARIKLPATNERGDSVLHGANLNVSRIADYWEQRMKLSYYSLPREIQNKYKLY